MIKVLHYAPGFRSGGIESRLLDWYRNIDRNKIQFILVKLNNIDDTENINEFKRMGGRFYNLPPLNFWNLTKFQRCIRNILISEQIDVVHVHSMNSSIFVLREALNIGINCRILHSRTTEYLPNEKYKLFKTIIRYATPKYANHFFACSYEAGLWGCGKDHKDEIVVIKNGIQDDKFVYNETIRNKIRYQLGIQDKIVLGTIGRLSPQKNLPFLLRLFSKLSDVNDKYVLLVVGDGSRNIIYDSFSNKKLPSNIIMVGNKKNVWDYYMSFDIFCSCSLYEGFGTTAIEAQATGLPTLLSTGFPETVVLTDFTYRIGVNDKDIFKWIEQIEKHEGKRYPNEGMRAVKNAGYCASVVAKDLQSFYLNNA